MKTRESQRPNKTGREEEEEEEGEKEEERPRNLSKSEPIQDLIKMLLHMESSFFLGF